MNIEVFRVFPDVLVSDSEVPEGVHDLSARHDTMKQHTPLQMPSLPYTFPPCTFGRIWPDDRLSSTSVRLASTMMVFSVSDDGKEETRAVYAGSAKAVVPLQMLSSRQKEFSEIGGKVSFGSTGAVAGTEGCAAVAVKVDGLLLDVGSPKGDKEGGEKGVTLELTGLPIHGNVRIGL